MSRKLNGFAQVETAEIGEPDLRFLSESVSRACDIWLRKRGLAIDRGGWGPGRKPGGDLENKTAELP